MDAGASDDRDGNEGIYDGLLPFFFQMSLCYGGMPRGEAGYSTAGQGKTGLVLPPTGEAIADMM